MSESHRNCFRLQNHLPFDVSDRTHYWCVVKSLDGCESRFLGHIGEPEAEAKMDSEKCGEWRPKPSSS